MYILFGIFIGRHIFIWGAGRGAGAREQMCTRCPRGIYIFQLTYFLFYFISKSGGKSTANMCIGNAPVIILFSCCRNSFGLVVHTIYFFFRNAYE